MYGPLPGRVPRPRPGFIPRQALPPARAKPINWIALSVIAGPLGLAILAAILMAIAYA